MTVFHIDLYRLMDPDEFYLLGVEERFDEAITFIEWIDRAPELARRADMIIEFSIDHDNENYRTVRVTPGTEGGQSP
jgi:tRNA threonylcarbamoyladenosine biosynthesis protein TsaE